MADKTTIINGIKNEGGLMKEAALAVASHPVSAGKKIKHFGIAFKEGTTSNKLTVLSGGLTGLTFTLSGLRSMRDGLRKDENGDRKWNDVAIGASQIAGGVVMATLFVERLKLSSDDAGILGAITDDAHQQHGSDGHTHDGGHHSIINRDDGGVSR